MDIDEIFINYQGLMRAFFCLSRLRLFCFSLMDGGSIGVIYGSIAIPGQEGQRLLETAINHLLNSFSDATGKPTVLWSMRFTQVGTLNDASASPILYKSTKSDQILYFAPPSLDLAFDDNIVESVRECWKAILGEEAQDDTFMTFEDRETYDDD